MRARQNLAASVGRNLANNAGWNRWKNYLFAGSDDGAERAAIIYTVLRCCRLAEVDPVEYLTEVLPVLARKIRRVDVAQLMPAAWARSRAAPFA